MSSNNMVHSKFGVVEADGNVVEFNPNTTGKDVLVDVDTWDVGSAGVDNPDNTSDTIQAITDKFGEVAFDTTFGGINDNTTQSSTQTYSINKINEIFDSAKNEPTELENGLNDGLLTIGTHLAEKGVSSIVNPESIVSSMSTVFNNEYHRGYNYGYINGTVGDARPEDVLETKIFSSKYGANVRGTIPVIPTMDRILALNKTYTVPNGYFTVDSLIRSVSVDVIKWTYEYSIPKGDSGYDVVILPDVKLQETRFRPSKGYSLVESIDHVNFFHKEGYRDPNPDLPPEPEGLYSYIDFSVSTSTDGEYLDDTPEGVFILSISLNITGPRAKYSLTLHGSTVVVYSNG